MPVPLSADRYAKQAGGFEPQRANNALLTIGVPGWGEVGELGWQGGSSDADNTITLSLETFPLPKEENVVIETRWMNERRKVAGRGTIADMEVVVRDFVDRQTARLLLAWRRMCYASKDGQKFGTFGAPQVAGALGLARYYKKSGTISLFPPDGSEGHTRVWALQGLFPLSMDPGDIDMSSDDVVKIRMTLSVDRINALRTPKTAGFTFLAAPAFAT